LNTQPGTSSPETSLRGIAGQVAANVSLMIAVLVYMGWAYDDALLGYFHVSPLDLNVGIIEYMLRSLTLFRPTIVIGAVILISITATYTWGLGWAKWVKRLAEKAMARPSVNNTLRRLNLKVDFSRQQDRQRALIAAGATVTATALLLAWIASYVQINTYILLALLASGPLLLTWPSRSHRRGRFPYSLAIVVAAVCALWAAALYAHTLGISAAQSVVHGLAARTAVAVYSVQPLALAGPGVTRERLPSGFRYHYRYEGLRLLITRSGTYYLLPVGWSPQLDLTYVLNESDLIRIELYSGIRR
jgi:hypothetical protein